jgi:hypothetical protein
MVVTRKLSMASRISTLCSPDPSSVLKSLLLTLASAIDPNTMRESWRPSFSALPLAA